MDPTVSAAAVAAIVVRMRGRIDGSQMGGASWPPRPAHAKAPGVAASQRWRVTLAASEVAMAKRVLIVAGPNGAGKTTLSLRILAGREDMVFLNADNIAERIASDRPGDVALDAGRQLLVELDRCVADGASFIVETTLAGRTYASRIPKWQETGYEVSLVFLALPTAEMALERVASRVAQGGHDIPADVIRRRFFSGLRNLRELYAPLVDFWQLFDASGPIPRLLEEGP